MCGFSPPSNSDTSCRELKQTQGLRAQSHKTATRTLDANHKSRLLSVLLTKKLCTGGSHKPLLRLNNLLQQLTEHKKTVYLLDHWFIIKRYNSETTRWKKCVGQSTRGGARSFHTLFKRTTRRQSPRLPTQKLLNASGLGFLWRLHYIGTIDYIIGN